MSGDLVSALALLVRVLSVGSASGPSWPSWPAEEQLTGQGREGRGAELGPERVVWGGPAQLGVGDKEVEA